LQRYNVAKGYGAPIFHVNGDDPDAVVRACRLAVDYRYQWGADVVGLCASNQVDS
jgi:2-oxoglutarate dehydrogenase E1 component